MSASVKDRTAKSKMQQAPQVFSIHDENDQFELVAEESTKESSASATCWTSRREANKIRALPLSNQWHFSWNHRNTAGEIFISGDQLLDAARSASRHVSPAQGSSQDIAPMGHYLSTTMFLENAGWRKKAFPLDWSAATFKVWKRMLEDDFQTLLAKPGDSPNGQHPYNSVEDGIYMFIHQEGWANAGINRRVQRLKDKLEQRRVFGISFYFDAKGAPSLKELLEDAEALLNLTRGFTHIVIVWFEQKGTQSKTGWLTQCDILSVLERQQPLPRDSLSVLRYEPTRSLKYYDQLLAEDEQRIAHQLQLRFPEVFSKSENEALCNDKLKEESSGFELQDPVSGSGNQAEEPCQPQSISEIMAAEKIAARKAVAEKVAAERAAAEKWAEQHAAAWAAGKAAAERASGAEWDAEKAAAAWAAGKAATAKWAARKADIVTALAGKEAEQAAAAWAAGKAAAERAAAERAAANRAAAEKADAERRAAEKAAAETAAAAAAAEKAADERAAANRAAALKAIAERRAAEKAAAEKAVTDEKTSAEKAAAQQGASEVVAGKIAAEIAEAKKAARDRAAAAKAAAAKAAEDKAYAEKVEAKRIESEEEKRQLQVETEQRLKAVAEDNARRLAEQKARKEAKLKAIADDEARRKAKASQSAAVSSELEARAQLARRSLPARSLPVTRGVGATTQQSTQLVARDLNSDGSWQTIGNVWNVVGLARLGSKLFCATTTDELYVREASLSASNAWKPIGHAFYIASMDCYENRLLGLLSDHTIWKRDPILYNVAWEQVSTAPPTATAIAVMDKHIFAVSTRTLWSKQQLSGRWQTEEQLEFDVVDMVAAEGHLICATKSNELLMRRPGEEAWMSLGHSPSTIYAITYSDGKLLCAIA